ncbi:MAG TPA: glycosyltransferase [Solirubrobacteraceae bacterium]|nr:glycosyltransferase [Solirubrobacteraceae bacterium]
MPPSTDDLTVGMVTKDDAPEILAEALQAAIGQGLSAPALVVDMSQGAGVRDVCVALGDQVRHVAYPQSRGVSDSRNEVLRQANTRYVLFLDADAVPGPGWAVAMRAAFDQVPDVAVVGARCVARWAATPPRLFSTPVAGDYFSLFDLGRAPLDVPRIVGTSYALDLTRIPSDPFPLELGFSPGQLLAGEENALCERAIADGWRVRYEPTALVEHTIKAARSTWPALIRRVFHAGQEGRRAGRRMEPLPRSFTMRDRLFLAAIAPAFLVGALVGPRSKRG